MGYATYYSCDGKEFSSVCFYVVLCGLLVRVCQYLGCFCKLYGLGVWLSFGCAMGVCMLEQSVVPWWCVHACARDLYFYGHFKR